MPAATTDPLERLEEALRIGGRPEQADADHRQPVRDDRLGPPARTSSYTRCAGSYQVDAVETEAPRPCHRAVPRGGRERYDVVVAFGGDGTVNEAANGLVGSDTPLSCLPGGRTNVYCRMLGIPTDVVDATEHLLPLADDVAPRRVDLARVNERHFLFSAGVGLDASVVEHVDAHPRLKARIGEWYYTWTVDATFSRRYLLGRRGSRHRRKASASRASRRRPERLAVHVLRRSGRSISARARHSTAATCRAWCSSAPARSTSRRSVARALRAHRARPATGRCCVQRESRRCGSARSTSGRCRCRSTATTSARWMRRRSE